MSTKEYAIRVDNLTKLYRIGMKDKVNETFAGTLLNFLKSPLNNFREYKSLYSFDDVSLDDCDDQNQESGVLCALRNVSFSVEQGEAIGIIGGNGAGKSTLLKILSRITHPTSGRIEIMGRISSLLEVGTGFHPDLTGKDNIYLNGTILGMRKAEVDRKFDEIVAFSGVEKFLNTPVKRYSSGMTVRLAFAVAAHLEPEILIIDEVLAVGDTAFQKKCIGKMQDVARGGRTVLFVSHNMAAVSKLCNTALLMKDGRLIKSGNVDDVIAHYVTSITDKTSDVLSERQDRKGSGEIKIQSVDYLNEQGKKIEFPYSGSVLVIRMRYRSDSENEFTNCRVSATIMKEHRPFILLDSSIVGKDNIVLSGTGYIDFIIPELPLSRGEYHISTFVESNNEILDWVDAAAEMSVIDGDFYGSGKCYPSKAWAGKTVLVKHNVSIVQDN